SRATIAASPKRANWLRLGFSQSRSRSHRSDESAITAVRQMTNAASLGSREVPPTADTPPARLRNALYDASATSHGATNNTVLDVVARSRNVLHPATAIGTATAA